MLTGMRELAAVVDPPVVAVDEPVAVVEQPVVVEEERSAVATGEALDAVVEDAPSRVVADAAPVLVDEPLSTAEPVALPEPAPVPIPLPDPEPAAEPAPATVAEAPPAATTEQPGAVVPAIRLWEGPMVGRDAELADLRDRLARVSEDRRAACVVVGGDAGTGRTRLVRELAASAGETRVRTVTCRSEDDGGARWPLADVVEALAGVGPRDAADDVHARLTELCADQPDADRLVGHLLSVLALDGITEPDEMRWVIRRLFEVAVPTPTLLVIEDADRTGAGFVRLLVDAVAAANDAPLLIVVTTTAPHGGVPGPRLGTLGADDAVALIDGLLGASEPGLAAAVAGRVRSDPLAIEHALAMLAEMGMLAPGEHRWRTLVDLRHVPMPDTATGLIRQRLQTLPPNTLAVLGVAAIAGAIFSTEPLTTVLPEDVVADLPAHLGDLEARGFLIHDQAPDVYAFRHSAIREAVVDGVPEWARVATHRAVGRHLEQVAGERLWRAADPVAAHLAASVERHPDGPAEDRDDALDLLTWSAAAAVDETDLDGAARLERRAASLLDEDPVRRAELLFLAAEHGALADPERPADREIAEAALAASVAGDDVDWRVRLLRARLRAAGEENALEAARAAADEAIATLGEDESTWALASAWALRGAVHAARGLNGLVADELSRAADHAASVGRTADETAALRGAAHALLDGPRSVTEAEMRCTSFLPRVRGPLAEHDVRGVVAVLQARRGAFDDARAAIASTIAALDELGSATDLATALRHSADIEALAGDPTAAERHLQRAIGTAASAHDEILRASLAGSLAHVLIDLDRLDDAWAAAELAQVHESDLASQVRWRMARARILARRGRAAPAERLVRDGLGLAERTDANDLRATALAHAADVRRHAGRPAEAEPFERRALRLFERRGATAQAQAIASRMLPPDPWKSASANTDAVVDQPEAAAANPLPAETLPAEPESNGAATAHAGNGFGNAATAAAPAAPAATDLSASADEESRRRWFTR